MAQVKLLKINSTTGLPTEFDSAADDITLASFAVTGGGPVMTSTGLDLNSTAVSEATSVTFTNPATGFINQTASNLIVDNIMAKDRPNIMAVGADILFPIVTDVAGSVDSFRYPSITGIPTATPAAAGEGYAVWSNANDRLYIWTGSAWQDQSAVATAMNIDNTFVAGEALTLGDVVYISAADTVSKASAATDTNPAGVLGFASASVASAGSVWVRTGGEIVSTGLTAGARYFLSPTTAGAWQTTVPSGAGQVIVRLGYARSATRLQIQIQRMGARAA